MANDEILLRIHAPEDKNFIYSTWLRGLYYGSTFYGSIDKPVFFTEYAKVIDHILLKPTTTVIVACLASEPDIVLGYAVQGPETLYFAFTKRPWRNKGILNLIIPHNISTITHLTKSINEIMIKKKWKFNPFKI